MNGRILVTDCWSLVTETVHKLRFRTLAGLCRTGRAWFKMPCGEVARAQAAGQNMIVGVINQKGGVGKTTLATHIAGELGVLGHRVVVVDADPQESAFDWSRMRLHSGLPKLFDVISLARETLRPEYATANDHVIIDGPSRNTALARSTVLASDLIL